MVPIGSYHEFLCHGCHGKLQWEKVDGQLVGDECEIPVRRPQPNLSREEICSKMKIDMNLLNFLLERTHDSSSSNST